ncbi:complex I NDUFA9 subunit family protein [Brevundimonas sp.]|jgi:NADH dehydrogenase|uniref:complex I NDUFA9 subunit family protein n=1 Tax=Brevundimonas sp. TaxID=1871086 RepID=UPI002EDB9A99
MSEVAPGLITVFGGSGFVGSQVVSALARRGWRIRIACRRPDRAWKLQTAGTVGQIKTIRCDATDAAQVAEALHGADAAINLVGILYEGGGRKFQDLHVGVSRTIAEACAAADIRLLQMSALGANPESASDYARTKAEAEMAVREVKPDAIIVRPSVVFGAGDDFLNKFGKMAQTAPVLPLIGGGQTKFQPVYVGDVAAAIAIALGRSDSAGQTYELGGPAIMTFEDVLKLVSRETYRTPGLVPLPFFVAKLIGALAQIPAIIGLKPVLTEDQVELLKSDNVVSGGAKGLADLGIEPTGVEAVAASYLWRYRKGGQFAEPVAA